MERKSIVGNTYGRLKVIKLDRKEKRKDKNAYNYYYLCKCSCGKEKVIKKENLENGSTKSCGCYQIEVATKNLNKINTKHGYSKHDGTKEKLYGVWRAIKDRCFNPNNKFYQYYGGRGINVYKDWKDDYVKFRTWALNNGYKIGLEIDRIDNNGNYEPDNCRWIPHRENLYNRNNTIKVKVNGIVHNIDELSKKFNIKKSTLLSRYERGKRNEELIKPVK